MTRKIKFGPGFKVRERISIISLSFICNPESNLTRWDVYIELLLRSRPEDYKSKVQIQEPMCVGGWGMNWRGGDFSRNTPRFWRLQYYGKERRQSYTTELSQDWWELMKLSPTMKNREIRTVTVETSRLHSYSSDQCVILEGLVTRDTVTTGVISDGGCTHYTWGHGWLQNLPQSSLSKFTHKCLTKLLFFYTKMTFTDTLADCPIIQTFSPALNAHS